MGKDEAVNGPKVAARILSRMSPSDQSRLLAQIKQRDLKLANAICQNISVFDDIADLQSQSVQLLIKAVEHNDLVLALKIAADKVKKVLFENMSERKRKVVEEDFAALPPTKISEVEESQRRILIKLDEFRTAGLIRAESDSDAMV